MLTPDSPIVLFGQLFFYGGLLVLMIGLPLFIWLFVRALRDIHSIAESLHWISHCTRPQASGAPAPAASKTNGAAIAPEPRVSNSAFGR